MKEARKTATFQCALISFWALCYGLWCWKI